MGYKVENDDLSQLGQYTALYSIIELKTSTYSIVNKVCQGWSTAWGSVSTRAPNRGVLKWVSLNEKENTLPVRSI